MFPKPLVIALLAGLPLSACGEDESKDATLPTLLTYEPNPRAFQMDAAIGGVLGINDAGCFAIGDTPIVVSSTWKVSADGSALELPSGARWVVGAPVHWGGGWVHDRPPFHFSAEESACVEPGVETGELLVLNHEE